MTVIIPIDVVNPETDRLTEAAAILRAGGVVAYPTETFYGLGADAGNAAAIEKIFAIKGRTFSNPVSVIVAAQDDVLPLVEEVPEIARILMRKFWPGALTLVFAAARYVSVRLTAGTGKIGIRVSSHPVALRLARELGAPITATSANLSGEPENASAAAVMRSLGVLPAAIVDSGETPGAPGSTILDVTVFPPRILREGAVSGEQIFSALGIEPH